ncbi:MAG: Gfo/Idh/MocA family oxidoreductase [Cyclobacteriaceae bacterium]|nr:Gfo/Idh/MocA family oxidoreductase [Cyclobacteriaceae bacterium]
MDINKKNSDGIQRRTFVKGSVLAAGGMMFSGLSLEAKQKKGKNDVLKIAVIGCGGRGSGAAVQALKADPNTKLVALADAFRDRIDNCYTHITAEEVKDWSGNVSGVKSQIDVPEKNKFVGFEAYKNAIDLADVVILTAPPGFRPDHLEYAIKQGKHVFCEKPVAVDAPGVRRVLALLEESKKKNLNVVVGLQRHYQTKYREIIKRVHAGEIGDVIAGQVYWNGGGVWVKDRLPGMTEMEYQMRNWYYFNWLSGDHIVEQHIHNMDVMNWAKQALPVKAQGMGGREVRKGKEHGEIFDHHYVEFTYEDGSIMNSQCRHIKGCMSKVAEQIIGTKGRAESNGTIVDLKGNVIYRHRDREDPNPYQVEHDEMFAAIRKGEAINDIEMGANATMTSIMGRMATYSGQEITWDQALNSETNLMPDRLAWDALPKVLPNEDGYYPVAVPGQWKLI